MRSNCVPNLHKSFAHYSSTTVSLPIWNKTTKQNQTQIFLINIDQEWQIQGYWYQIKTNVNFGCNPKVQASAWVPGPGYWSFMNCAPTVHKCMKQKRSEEFSETTFTYLPFFKLSEKSQYMLSLVLHHDCEDVILAPVFPEVSAIEITLLFLPGI